MVFVLVLGLLPGATPGHARKSMGRLYIGQAVSSNLVVFKGVAMWHLRSSLSLMCQPSCLMKAPMSIAISAAVSRYYD